MLPEEYTGLMTNIMAKQLTIPSRQVCQEKSWKVGLLNTHTQTRHEQHERMDITFMAIYV